MRTVLHCLALGAALSATAADRFAFDEKGELPSRTMLILEADPADLERCIKWELGKDDPLVSFNELIRLARSRVKLQEGMRPRENYHFNVAGVDWRPSVHGGWVLKIGFMAKVKQDTSGKTPVLIRDDGVLLFVWILPNGGEIHPSSRPMTEDELVDFGLKPPTFPPGTLPPPPLPGGDPFAPPPVPSKK
jgi:hypothetical protein